MKESEVLIDNNVGWNFGTRIDKCQKKINEVQKQVALAQARE
jgi:hypothetical protein